MTLSSVPGSFSVPRSQDTLRPSSKPRGNDRSQCNSGRSQSGPEGTRQGQDGGPLHSPLRRPKPRDRAGACGRRRHGSRRDRAGHQANSGRETRGSRGEGGARILDPRGVSPPGVGRRGGAGHDPGDSGRGSGGDGGCDGAIDAPDPRPVRRAGSEPTRAGGVGPVSLGVPHRGESETGVGLAVGARLLVAVLRGQP